MQEDTSVVKVFLKDLAWLFLISGVGMLAIVGSALAAGPRATVQVQPVYTDNGSLANSFAVNCTSLTWTILTSSDPVKRSQSFQFFPSTSTNSVGVCLGFVNYTSSLTASAFSNPNSTVPVSVGLVGISSNTACGDSTPGVELSTSTVMVYTDYGTAAWSCRTRPSGNGVVKGIVDEDVQDTKGSWYFPQ